MGELRPLSTTNFQKILTEWELAANYHSPQCVKIISIYAANSIKSKFWWWIRGECGIGLGVNKNVPEPDRF
jgi:hypothetical protein